MKCPKCHADNPETKQYCGDCGTPLPSPVAQRSFMTETLQTPVQELTTGSTFAGRYQIIEELGHGGMGRVYRALDKKLNEEVALKLVRPEIAVDRSTLERFSNELKLARKISHPHVGRMYELMEEAGTHFITMEYVPGQDLRGLIRQTGQLTVGKAVAIAMEICEGLAEAHKQGVVHRDLKPSNIIIDRAGGARIMDFGIARSLRSKGTTGPGVMVGTPEYMSPEQVEGQEADQRSDIYSLGIIFYEMLTGHVPFEGDTPFTIGVKHKSEIPRDPREINTQIPPDLDRLVLKCLDKDKAARYQTAGELHSDLEKVEQSFSTTVRTVAKGKPSTSKKITAKFNIMKLALPLSAVIALAAVAYWLFIPKKYAPSIPLPKSSIAVLPFVDSSQAKDYEYLCDGITDTLINALTNIEGLWVPARTSAFFFKGKTQDIREIGQKLNVDNVLEGSVQVAGDDLRIHARISKVLDGRQIWSAIFNRKMKELFAIQDEIAQAIVDALKIKLLGEKEAPLVKKYTNDLQAYNLYLQGRYFWNKRTVEDLNKAISFFTQAIEMDPNYALAYVGLADCHIGLQQFARTRQEEVLPKARAAVLKALEIDDRLAEAHASLAMIMTREWNWEGAGKEYQQAIALNPNYATSHHWYSLFLSNMGRLDESRKEIERALQLDPLSLIINTAYGSAFKRQREYDQAILQGRKTLELDPNFAEGQRWLGSSYLQKGMFDEAIAEFQKARIGFGKSPYGLGDLGNAYALSGDKAKAREVLTNLEDLLKLGYSLNYDIAFVYLGLGDKNRAFEWLEKAYKERDVGMISIKTDPAWDNVRSDPRFKSLLKRMNLE